MALLDEIASLIKLTGTSPYDFFKSNSINSASVAQPLPYEPATNPLPRATTEESVDQNFKPTAMSQNQAGENQMNLKKYTFLDKDASSLDWSDINL